VSNEAFCGSWLRCLCVGCVSVVISFRSDVGNHGTRIICQSVPVFESVPNSQEVLVLKLCLFFKKMGVVCLLH
jgi:hypothetical protein